MPSKRDDRGADSGDLHLDEAVGAELRGPFCALRGRLSDGAEVGEEPAPRLGQVDELLERGGFAAMPRLFQRPPCNSRLARFLPASEVIQRVEIAESPVKRTFHGIRPHPFNPPSSLNYQSPAYSVLE